MKLSTVVAAVAAAAATAAAEAAAKTRFCFSSRETKSKIII